MRILAFGNADQCFGGTGTNAGGGITVFLTVGTAGTFCDFSVCCILGRAVGTGHSATVAADAFCSVINGQATLVLAETENWTCGDAGSLGAVHTAQGQEGECSAVYAGFQCADDSKHGVTVIRSNIVLVHTGYGTGAAGDTLV